MLAENARDIIYRYRFSPNRGFEYVSPAATAITGYTPEEHYADPDLAFKLVYPDDRPLLAELFQAGDAFNRPLILRWQRKDGSLIWTEQQNRPIYDEAGQLVALEGIARDVTERRRAEEELRRSRDLLHKVLSGLNAAVFIVGPYTRTIEDCNRMAETMFGYSRAELVGQDTGMLHVNQESFEKFGRYALQAYSATGTFTSEYQMKRKNGDVFYTDHFVTPVYDETGGLLKVISVVRDITAQKRAEESLRASEERFRQVVVSISDHVYVAEFTKENGWQNLYLSPHVETLTGYPVEKFAADWHFWSSVVIHPADRAVAAAQAVQLASGCDSEVEYRMLRADGRIIWVRDSARVHVLRAAKIVYGLVSNITDRKQGEEEIRTLNEQLEHRVADRTRELSALYEITAVASEARPMEFTLKRILERVLAAMRCREGTIHLLSETGQTMFMAAQEGVPDDVIARLERLPVGLGLAGWVFEHGETLLVPDMAVDRRVLGAAVRSPGRYAYLGAPMRAGGQVVGVLGVVGEADQQFNVEEVVLLNSIADQVGVVVENARLRRQAEAAAVMEERARLARELHDSVTQSLYSLTLLAGGGQRLSRAGNLIEVEAFLADLGEIAQQALKEMRLLIYQLRPPLLERQGLVGALQQRLDAVEDRAGVETRLLVDAGIRLSALVEAELYRIAQEALNNALKHASATTVTVRLYAQAENVILEVTDNGCGFEAEIVSGGGGLGLQSMSERAGRLGATLAVLPAPGGGTQVKVSLTGDRATVSAPT